MKMRMVKIQKKIVILLFTFVFSIAFFAFTPRSAHAIINLVGNTGLSTESLGGFTGKLSYSAASAAAATLKISLTNTSNPSNGGYIVAFALNNPFDYISGATVASPNFSNFGMLGVSSNAITASPFGDFDFGASNGTNFQGGPNPVTGIGIGQTGEFTFSLSGSSLNLLSEQSFVDALSENSNRSTFFITRFRGFDEGAGSDKVPASTVPEPASMLLFGIGIFGAGVLRRRSNKV